MTEEKTVVFDDGTEVTVTNDGDVTNVEEPPETWLKATDNCGGVAHFVPEESRVCIKHKEGDLGKLIVCGTSFDRGWEFESSDAKKVIEDVDPDNYSLGFTADTIEVVDSPDE